MDSVIHLLTDIVSKSGNMMLNFQLLPGGTLDAEADRIVENFTAWMAVNRLAIHTTRPWKVHGEGPMVVKAGKLLNDKMKPFTALDICFSTKGNSLYAICLGVPKQEITVPSLGGATGLWTKPVTRIRVLGSDAKLKWKREVGRLRIQPLQQWPCDYTVAFEIVQDKARQTATRYRHPR